MSKFHTTKIACPECKKPYKIKIWDSVNVQLNPEKKEELLSNAFFKTVCPHCKAETYCIYGFLYHDMSKKYMISLMQDYSNISIMDDMSSEYFFRKVEDPNQLIEKIRIFDAGLNDIVMEIMKKIVSDIMKLKPNMLFCNVEKDDFVFLILGEEEKAISVPRSIYDMILKDCTHEDLKEYPEFMVINQCYIEQLMK